MSQLSRQRERGAVLRTDDRLRILFMPDSQISVQQRTILAFASARAGQRAAKAHGTNISCRRSSDHTADIADDCKICSLHLYRNGKLYISSYTNILGTAQQIKPMPLCSHKAEATTNREMP